MKENKVHLARKFNHTFRYIDDLISLNNPEFKNFINTIYPKELELKETTEGESGCSYLDLFLFKDSNCSLKSRLYDKRDDFSFTVVNYPYIDSNVPKAPCYRVYISRIVCFARACSDYHDFVSRHNILVKKLLSQGYEIHMLRKSFKKFMENHENLVSQYNIQLSSFLKSNLSLCSEHVGSSG